MKKLITTLALVAALLVAAPSYAYTFPTEAELKTYTARMEVYIGMGQSPEQVAESLNRYFGKDFFYAVSNGWQGTADLRIQFGSGNQMTYMQVIGTM
jgi:hypothetical protein